MSIFDGNDMFDDALDFFIFNEIMEDDNEDFEISDFCDEYEDDNFDF